MADLFRQSVYSHLAGYEDTNDAERLAKDPTFRMLASRERRELSVALSSTLHWFETEVLINPLHRACHSGRFFLGGALPRFVRVGRAGDDRGVLLQAGLILGDHFRDRTHHPEMRRREVVLEHFVRLREQVVDSWDAQRLDRCLGVRLLDKQHLEVPPLGPVELLAEEDRKPFTRRAIRLALEEVALVHAIDGSVLGYLGPGKTRQRGEGIDLVDNLIRFAIGGNLTRPPCARQSAQSPCPVFLLNSADGSVG